MPKKPTKEVFKRYNQSVKGKAKKKRYDQSAKGKAVKKRCGAKYCDGNPKKSKARKLVQTAIKNGSLVKQPCEVCDEAKAQAHHDDYDRPLVVRWLCQPHHHEWHQANGPGLNGK